MNWRESGQFLTQPLMTLGKATVSLANLIEFVVIIALVLAASRVTRQVLRYRVLPRTKLEAGLQYAIARIVGYVVLVFGFVIGLETLGVDLSSFKVVAGALSLGIGFGLQNIVNNFISGLIILAERPIQMGDRVDLGSAVGRVTRIGARSTSVLTNDNIIIIVPNAEFVSNRVTNWTLVDSKVRFSIPIGVAYGSDVRVVERLLLEAAAANPHVLKDPAPSANLQEFGNSAINFLLRVWSSDLVHSPERLRSQLNFAIWDKFKQAGIEIPFPQSELHVKEPIRIELKREA